MESKEKQQGLEKDDPEIARMLQEIRQDREGSFPPVARYIGYGLAFFTIIALGVLTIISSRDLPFASQIYGPSAVLPARSALYRIAILDPDRSAFLQGVKAEVFLSRPLPKQKIEEVQLASGKTKGEVLTLSLPIPDWPPETHAKLRFVIESSKGRERIERPLLLASPRKIVPTYAPERALASWGGEHQKNDPFRLRFFTEGRALIADIPNTVYALIEETSSPPASLPSSPPPPPPPSSSPTSLPAALGLSGRPLPPPLPRLLPPPAEMPTSAPGQPSQASPPQERWQALSRRVWLQIKEGSSIYGPSASDRMGLIRFQSTPQLFRLLWKIKLWGHQGLVQGDLEIKTEGYQITLEPGRILLGREKTLPVRIESLSRSAPVFLEWICQGRVVAAYEGKLQGGKLYTELAIPPEVSGICSLQTFSEFYQPGDVYDTRLVYRGPQTKEALLQALREHLIQRGDGLRLLDLAPFLQLSPTPEEFEPWSRALFGFAKARFVTPVLFHDSARLRLKELRRYQRDFRRQTLITLGAIGAFVLLAVFFWMYSGYRRDQARLHDFLAENGVTTPEDRLEIAGIRAKSLSYILLAIVVLALFFAAVLYLFSAMRWTYDHL